MNFSRPHLQLIYIKICDLFSGFQRAIFKIGIQTQTLYQNHRTVPKSKIIVLIARLCWRATEFQKGITGIELNSV